MLNWTDRLPLLVELPTPKAVDPSPPALALALALRSPFLHRFFDPTPSKALTSNYRARLHWLGGLASPARECTGLVSLCSWFLVWGLFGDVHERREEQEDARNHPPTKPRYWNLV